MKQVININFQGRVVPIEVSAYEILKSYTESLNRHFAAEEGKEEIINDIESRIGELFQDRIKEGATCITDDDVNAIIRSMGRPEDFETDEPSFAGAGANAAQNNTENTQQNTSYTYNTAGAKRLFRDENHKIIGGVCSGVANYFGIDMVVVRILFLILFFSFGFGIIPYIILWIAVPSSASTEIGSKRKRLFRDPEDKYIGGVCSGLAHYFGVNVWIPRVLFLIPFVTFAGRWSHWGFMDDFPNFISLGFSPITLFVYIILWLVLPEAATTAEKLEMKGEKVDMNSIKNSVMEEMKGVQQRAQKFGKEAMTVANEKGRTFGTEAGSVAKRGSRSLGDIIVFLFKVFGYFILGCFCLGLISLLFVFGIGAMGVFPLKDYVLTDGWQNVFAWGTLLFFIIAPMLGIITWIIRKLAKIKGGSKMLRLGFGAMFVTGLICFICLIASVRRDFRYTANIAEQEVFLPNPKVQSLEITTLMPGQRYSRNRFFNLQPFENSDEDTVFVRNINVHIMKSPNDSFKVTMIRLADGRTKRYADTLASLINFNVQQKDSLLVIDRGFGINKTNKFRNQRIIITVYVPVGKQIKVHDNTSRYFDLRLDGPWAYDHDYVQFENLEEGWDEGVWYNMTTDGLYNLDGKPADSWKRDRMNEGTEINVNGRRIKVNKNGVKIDTNPDSDSGTYRYNSDAPPTKLDSLKIKLQQEEKKTKDSLQKAKEKIEKQLEKIDGNGGTAKLSFSLPGHDPLLFLN